MTGTRCTCGAGHETYGACIRAKGIHIGQVDHAEQRRWDAELNFYRDARRQGIQPATTQRKDVEVALEISQQAGRPFSATDRSFAA